MTMTNGEVTGMTPGMTRPLWRVWAPWAAVAVGAVVAWILAGAFMPAGLPFGIALQGLIYGGLDAMTAMGIVLVYRSARIINFAQAEIGGLCASFAVIMVAGSHLNYFVALGIGMVVALVTGAMVDLVFMRRLANAPRLIVTVATIGIAQLLGAVEIALPSLYGTGGVGSVNSFHFPAKLQFHLGMVLFNSDRILVMVVVPLVLLGLWWMLGRTDVGVAIRGSADSRERAMLLGIPVKRLSLITWVVAAGLSGIGSMLAQPIQGQSIGNVAGPEAFLIPMAAAMIAGWESLPVAFVASLGLGEIEQAIRWSYPQTQSSAVDVVVFAVILVALLLRRRRSRRVGELLTDAVAVREIRPISAALRDLTEVRVFRFALPALLLIAAIFAPIAASASRLLLLSDMVIFGIIAVSLVILTGWAGQISLGQFAFVGVGGAACASVMVHFHANLFLGLLVGAAAGAGSAALIGIPALRAPGLDLAAVTLAFAVAVSTYFLSSKYFPWWTPTHVGRPLLFGRFDTNQALVFYYVCLLVLVGAIAGAVNYRRARIGRSVVAVRDNDRGAAAYAISPMRSKLSAFAFSGALAGMAGGLYVVGLQGIQYGGFDPEQSIVVFTMVVVGGLGSLAGGLIGAAYVEGVLYWLHGGWTLFASSTGLLLILMLVPEGLGSLAYRVRDWLIERVAARRGIDTQSVVHRPRKPASGLDGSPAVAVSATTHRAALRLGALEDLEASAPSGAAAADVPNPLILCTSVDAAYGETQVLFDVDVAVGAGEVVALLGTNGAGKSTLLKVMNGVLVPVGEGRVVFHGEDITGWTPQRRAAAGLVTVPGGRGVFTSLTVRENLRLAGWLAGTDKVFVEEAMGRALSLFPALKARFETRAGLLSGGEQQMLTIAQAMLCKPKLLLIDELSMGLAPAVVGELLRVVRSLAESGVTVMVVEQSVNVATVISRRAIFMERGHVRFSGPTPSLAQQPELLRSVFLRAAAKAQSTTGATGLLAAPDGGAGPPQEPAGTAVTNGHVNGAKPPVLQVNGATKSYGGVMAINDVSISVDEGEILGVIGTNGAGKTTLFDVCSGFVVPDTGSVLLNGRDITHLGPNWRAKNGLGRVFQESRLFPSMTVAEALAVAFETQIEVKDPFAAILRLGAVIDSESKLAAQVEELMDQLGLSRWHDTFVSELSTGTRRILELGCVMAHNPKLLLLDEPSAGIAQRESEALSELLRGIAEQSRASMVIIEHDVPLVSSVADRLVCMHLGEIISQGTTAAVLNDDLVIDAYLGRDEETLAAAGPAGTRLI